MDNLQHYYKWMEDQRQYLNAKEKFSTRDAEILSHAYVRNFPNRLHLILAELLMEKQSETVQVPRDLLKQYAALLEEITELESQRDKIGRHTNVSAHFEMLMTNHEKVFIDFQVVKKEPKNAI